MAVTEPLVSTAWLADHLDQAEVAIIDASWHMPAAGRDAKAEFGAGHIPGAVFFGIDDICDQTSGLPHMLAAPADFAVAARRLGVSQNSYIVVYDTAGLFSAARVWWNFRAMGHEAVAVLDGGLPRWIAEGRPLESGWRSPAHGDFKATPVASLVADLAAVRRAVASGAPRILDARARDRFSGEAPEPREDLRRGHMPGARNLPWSEIVGEGSLGEPEVLKAALTAAGVDIEQPVIATCGSGISAALLALAIARAGGQDAAVYDGSWAEWGADPATPVASGPA